jgi:energy-converting hydrogenase Eha subunit C
MDMPMHEKHCKCPHHKVVPLAIILIGLAFLLQALNYLSVGAVAIIWPILIIIIGLMKLTRGMCKCYKM